MAQRDRISWIDSLKGLAIFFVILGHVLLGFQQVNTFPNIQQEITLIKEWIYTWHMPLFFILSGITFRISCIYNNTVNIQKVKRNIVNLSIIYLIFETILPVLKIVFSKYVNNPVGYSELIRMILLPSTLMWYLWVLVIYYIFFSFIIKRGFSNSMVIIVLLILSIMFNYLYHVYEIELCLKNLCVCAIFFYMGIKCSELSTVVLKKKVIALCILASVCIMIYLCYTYLISREKNLVIYPIVEELNAVVISIVLLNLFVNGNIGNNGALKICGEHSLIIYLLHSYFITAMRYIVIKMNISYWFLSICLCTFIPLFISICMAYFLPSIPGIKYLFKPIQLYERVKSKQK